MKTVEGIQEEIDDSNIRIKWLQTFQGKIKSASETERLQLFLEEWSGEKEFFDGKSNQQIQDFITGSLEYQISSKQREINKLKKQLIDFQSYPTPI